MRLKEHRAPLIALSIVVALMIFAATVGGCSSNPRVDFANTQEVYIAAVQTLVDNREAIGEEKWQGEVLPLINAGDAALDQYDTLTKLNQPADSAAITLRRVLTALAPYLDNL